MGEGEERMLEFHLLEFTEVFEESCLSLLPHVMCNYLYDLTKKYNSYIDFVRKAGPIVDTSRLLLCEATAVVMRECFRVLSITPDTEYLYRPELDLLRYKKAPMDVYAPVTVEVGVEPDRKEQNMAEIEQKAKTPLDLEIVDRFITPFVPCARNPLRKSRFEVFSIRPFITRDCEFEDGNMFGLILVSDKYGLRSDGGTHLFEPDFPYVALCNHEWCDPLKIRQDEIVYLGNPGSHHSVPFSSSIQIRVELYVTTKKKDDCFQLCDRKFKLDLKNFWDEKSYSKCGRLNIKGEDGRLMMHYILIKDAVDVDIALDVTFKADPDRKVYAYIDAFYGGEFSYDCHPAAQDKYKALLCRSFITVGSISLKRSALSVPKNASLNIKAYLVDADTNEAILNDCYEFPQGRCNGIMQGFEDGASLDMKVVWKY